MERLWKITSDTAYRHYFLKWRQPMEQPYVWRAFHDRNRSGLIMSSCCGWLLLWVAGWLPGCCVVFRKARTVRALPAM
jgi:hypothetical protein